MSRRDINIILTCVGSPMSWEMIKAFVDAESLRVNVIGVDMNPNSIGKHFLNRFYVVPSGRSPEYSEVLMDICKKEDIHVVIPGSDEEAFNLSRNNDFFQRQGIICTVPAEKLIETMSNKTFMYETLEHSGISIPHYFKICSLDDLTKATEKLGYPQNPFVLKLSSGRGGRGIWKVCAEKKDNYFFGRSSQFRESNLKEIFNILERMDKFPSLIAMECLHGDFYDVDVLSKEGKSLFTVVRKRLNPFGIPFRGSVFERNDEILSLAENINKILALTYLYDIDIAYSTEKGAQLLELNPRPSGSVVATVKAGLNLFEHLLRMAIGIEVPEGKVPYGVTVLPKTVLSRESFA